MTTEQKAKAYDESLEMAKKELKTCGSLGCDAARQIFRLFPQLAESEDERIRKELIEYLTHRAEVTGFVDEDKDCKRWIAWLEKQKEQKPNYCHYGGDPNVERCKYCSATCSARLTEEQKEQKPVEVKDPFSNANFVRGYESGYADAKREQKPNTVSIKDATKFGNLEYERGVKDGIQSEKSRQWKPSEEELKLLRYLAKKH